MAMQPPPSRYRVVEKGRTLVVIDTAAGTPAAAPEPPTRASSLPERIAFDGRSTIVTRPFYDDKAPRTLTLDPGATRLIENGRGLLVALGVAYALVAAVQPWVLVPLLVVLDPRARAAARAAATRWLDRYDADTRTG